MNLTAEGGTIVPRLRLTVGSSSPPSTIAGDLDTKSESSSPEAPEDHACSRDSLSSPDDDDSLPPIVMTSNLKYAAQPNTLFALQNQHLREAEMSATGTGSGDQEWDDFDPSLDDQRDFLETVNIESHPNHLILDGVPTHEIIVPLTSDTAFYRVLVSALQSLSEHQKKVQEEFTQTVQHLTLDISNVSRPSSSRREKSDLHAWRQIFQMWVDAQIFESNVERDRGERSVDETESRLTEFANKVVQHGLGDRRTLRRKESRNALERFLQINVLLLDLKKVRLWFPCER